MHPSAELICFNVERDQKLLVFIIIKTGKIIASIGGIYLFKNYVERDQQLLIFIIIKTGKRIASIGRRRVI